MLRISSAPTGARPSANRVITAARGAETWTKSISSVISPTDSWPKPFSFEQPSTSVCLRGCGRSCIACTPTLSIKRASTLPVRRRHCWTPILSVENWRPRRWRASVRSCCGLTRRKIPDGPLGVQQSDLQTNLGDLATEDRGVGAARKRRALKPEGGADHLVAAMDEPAHAAARAEASSSSVAISASASSFQYSPGMLSRSAHRCGVDA